MKIRSLKIVELFNLYSYKIEFGFNRVRIITGPNGYGKTTILQIINSLANKDLLYYMDISFEEIEVIFDNGQSITITQKVEQHEASDTQDKIITVSFLLRDPIGGESKFDINSENVELIRINAGKKIYVDDGTLYINEDGEKTISNHEIVDYLAKKGKQEQFLLYLSDFKCSYIPADRLHLKYSDIAEYTDSVEYIAKSIQDMIKNERDRFLSQSQKINEQMLDRLIEDNSKPLSKDEYLALANDLKKKTDLMREFDLSDSIAIRGYDEKLIKVLSVDLKATEEKLNYAESFLNKMVLFKELIFRKQFANKSLKFDRRVGIMMINSETGEAIDLRTLSSGEKNELVMMYKLVFSTVDEAVLLIDEPENSLHVAWLIEIVDNLEAVGEMKDLQIIVTTHSPDIIDGKNQITYDLYEMNEHVYKSQKQ